MFLSEAQRKYLVHEQIIGSALFNLMLNAGLAWLGFRHHDAVPMRGDPSILNDAIGTAVLLPLLTCLIVTPLVRKRVRSGKLEPLIELPPGYDMLHWLPSWSFFRGLVLALLCLAWVTPLYLGLLFLCGVESMSVGGFVVVKGLYAAIMAAQVSPAIALYVMATTELSEDLDAVTEISEDAA
jgi:hypothetical protein